MIISKKNFIVCISCPAIIYLILWLWVKPTWLYGMGVVENNPLQAWNTWATLSRHSILGVSALTWMGKIIMMHNFTITTAPHHRHWYLHFCGSFITQQTLNLCFSSSADQRESLLNPLECTLILGNCQLLLLGFLISIHDQQRQDCEMWHIYLQPSFHSPLLQEFNSTASYALFPRLLLKPHPLQVCRIQWRKQESWRKSWPSFHNPGSVTYWIYDLGRFILWTLMLFNL